MNAAEAQLLADLDALGIAYDVVEHEAVFTVEQSHAVDRDIPGAHTKNLFLKDAAGVWWLVTVPALARVDLKALPAAIGSKRLSFGKGDDMERLIGVSPGSVTALAAINDGHGAVNFVLDASLATAGRVNCHPLRNTATLGLSGPDLVRAQSHWGRQPLIVDVPVQL
jgi:Ala-tRNA(Pro) deacylase